MSSSPLQNTFLIEGSRGRKFLVLFMENVPDPYASGNRNTIHIAGRRNFTVSMKTAKTLPSRLKGKLNKSISARSGITEIDVPIEMGTLDLKKEFKGIVVETSETVSLFSITYDGYTSDSTLILPVERLGRRYVVGSSAPYNSKLSDYNSQVAFAATEDKTIVTVTFNIADGHALVFKGKTYETGHKMEFEMNQLEDFQISHNRDLTGTIIESSKPIAVFAGNKCNKLSNYGYCSHLMDQLPPTNNLDKVFIVPPNLRNSGSVVRVVAHTKTSLQIQSDGQNTKRTLEKTRHYDLQVKDNAAAVIKADEGVLVLNFAAQLTRRGRNGGEPYMTVVPGLEQYLHQYYVAVPKGYKNYLTVIIPSKAKNSLLLNSEPIATRSIVATSSVTVPAGEEYVTMVIGVPAGAHQVETRDGTRFGLLIYGRGNGDGYGYTANMVGPGMV